MKLRDVTFERWMAGHPDKPPDERWLRELYPWPVIAEIDYAEGSDLRRRLCVWG